MLLANAQVHRTLLSRSTGKATTGWETMNALQFLESEPWTNILTVGECYVAMCAVVAPCLHVRDRSQVSPILPPPEGRDHSLGRVRAELRPTVRTDIRRSGATRMRGPSALKMYHCKAYEVRGDAGMEELDYATCEASFETKSGNEGRADVGCRRSVSLTSGGRIRDDQRAGRGYADDEEHYTRTRDHPR
jgi:hypothetical protein